MVGSLANVLFLQRLGGLDLYSVQMLVAFFLSFCNLSLLFYQGSVLFWTGRIRSHSAAFAGISLLVAGVFFVLHVLALDSLRRDQPDLLSYGKAALYIALLLPQVFMINVALSQRPSRTGRILSRVRLLWMAVAIMTTSLLLGIYFFMEWRSPMALLSRDFALIRLVPAALAVCIPVVYSLGSLYNNRRTEAGAGSLAATALVLGAVFLATTVVALHWYFLISQSGSCKEGFCLVGLLRSLLYADLVIQCLVGVAVVLASRASILFEVFSAHMPRLGMLRYFKKNLALLIVASVLFTSLYWYLSSIQWALAAILPLSSTIGYLEYRLMKDRERLLSRMRPLSDSDLLYDRLFEEDFPATEELGRLCGELQSPGGAILPGGPFAALLHEPIAYGRISPMQASTGSASNAAHSALFDNIRIPLSGKASGIGELILSSGGRRITSEEREFARLMAERILDTAAVFRFARILMQMQKEYLHSRKLSETSARRVLHDEVLPEIHGLILEQSSAEIQHRLSAIHKQIASLLRNMPGYDNALLKEGLMAAIRSAVAASGLDVALDIKGEEPPLESSRKEVLFFAVRELLGNAVRHGTGGSAQITMDSSMGFYFEIQQWSDLTTANPGGPVDRPAFSQKDFEAGSSAPKSGRGSGQGLSIHSALLMLSGGSLEIREDPQRYRAIIKMDF